MATTLAAVLERDLTLGGEQLARTANEERCTLTDLIWYSCAHCTGRYGDEDPRKPKTPEV